MAVLAHEGTYPIMYGRFDVPVGSGYRPGYLARPDRVGRFPVVLVLPAVEGLSSHEKDICRQLGRRGLAALAVNLYRVRTGDALDDYAALSDRSAIADLDEVAQFLASEDVDWAHAGAMGMLGLDVGGRFTLTMAANRPWVAAAAVTSTPLTGDEERHFQVAGLLEHLAVPVLGLYGASDEFIDAGSVDEAQNRNPSGEWLLYEGASHNFLDSDAETYHPDAAADAVVRLAEFFKTHLPAASTEDLG